MTAYYYFAQTSWNPLKYLNLLSWQIGLLSPVESSFTPESCRSLLLRSSSRREEFDDCRAEATTSQCWSL